MSSIDGVLNKHFEVFYAVCRNMSMSAAAKELYLSQPAISRKIKELEDFYKCALFKRFNGKLILTDEGQQLYEFISKLDFQIKEFDEKFFSQKYLLEHLAIGTIPTLGETLFPCVMNQLIDSFSLPDNGITFTIYSTSVLLRMLQEGEIDFALVDTVPGTQYPTLIFDYMFTSEQKVVCAKDADYPEELDIAELATLPLLVKESGSGARMGFDAVFAEHGLIPNIRIVSSTSFSLLGFVVRKMGVAILPGEMLTGNPLSSQIREISVRDHTFKRSFYLCYNNKYRNSVKIEILKQVLLDCLYKAAEKE